MSFAQANGIKLYYEMHGQGEPLVLISGFTEDHTAWEDVVAELAKDFRVLTFDNRGAGQTITPEKPFTTEEMADDTVALMSALDIPKAHVLGHSMGGSIAQQIALRHPKNILKLIIACSVPKLDSVSLAVINTGAKLVNAKVPFELLLDNIFPWIFSADFLSDEKKVAKALAKKINNPHPQTLIGYKHQLVACNRHDTLARLSEIKTPTLVLGCARDLLISPSHSEWMAEKIPNAQLKILPSLGHIPQVENPTLFCKTIKEFLK